MRVQSVAVLAATFLLPPAMGAAQSPPPPLAASAAIEQTTHGTRPSLPLVASFDGLGAALHAGDTPPRNPSDNSLAVGPDHVMQTVNSQVTVFTKQGRLVYGPIGTQTFFQGFGEVCGARPNGDAVVRYDQLAKRWLIVMPIFRRAVTTTAPGAIAPPGVAARPGQASIRAPRRVRRPCPPRRPSSRPHRRMRPTPSATP
ncbi:MAG: hypothetical protein U0P30_08495 [Vicinamibacterales bacterium]